MRHSRHVISARVWAVGLVLITAVACGSDGATSGDAPQDNEVVDVQVDRAVSDSGAAQAAGSAVGILATDLYGVVRTEQGNLAISPYSVAAALSMIRAGAGGATASQLDDVLHVEFVDDLHAAFGSLDADLATRSGTFPSPDGDDLTIELTFGNALWPQRDFPFEAEFLELLSRHYGAGVNVVDYAADPEAARLAINEWVSESTNDRIPELLAAGVLGAATRLVLTNALYLNAPWQHPFVEGGTTDGDFVLLDDTTVGVPFMRLDEQLASGDGPGWQAVRLPYGGNELSMVIIVPDRGRFSDIEAELTADFLGSVSSSLTPGQVQLRLPSWEQRTQLILNEPLQALGLIDAFGPQADFSAMSSESLFISDVVHEVFVSVDEAGTEAAAATAVVMIETAAPAGPPRVLDIDRPFIYSIVDDTTGAVLFLGRVVNPAA